ncbi:alpha/beta hydrolase family protein [Novosphingobium sp. JCM 18896]|uniref:alpha/beta hydrolase family protein n=1 Tax=Novosphingobium sp. JCM 18896 TaxID=2989731 RepID=UPI0022233608|nr:alpha/beta hydrolase [Novosphingobium sp. JCM 18896]MCW1432278.1 alpha/beta hydrolase [Novosphingobium sp. JCM 18896]
MDVAYDLDFEWLHIAYNESSAFVETYGFAGNQGAVNLEGILIRPRGVESDTLVVMMHPASTLQLLPVPRAAAHRGAHVLCAASRYARNDTAAILEKVLLDLGAYIRHAKHVLGYRKIVLLGWSGGGSLSLFYQAQAENPTITHTPAGDPVDIRNARLIPADAVVFQAAHISRARLLLDIIDPSVVDENHPDRRNSRLDIYDPSNPNRPPYSEDFLLEYRAAQLARVRRITEWVKTCLDDLKRKGGAEVERGFVTHRTLADPRFLDTRIDPNDRRPGWCYLGNPETVNTGPVGLGRFSTLRAWLSQWSIDDSQADGLQCIANIHVPLLVIENTADDAVPQPHARAIFDAAVSLNKRFERIEGATHYYAGQPELLAQANRLLFDWMEQCGLAAK